MVAIRTRNIAMDAVKALAIWLVVYGHCIQYLTGVDIWTDKVFNFIYSFHMPLFFIVSGFFFTSSLKLGQLEFVRKKSIALLLPCFVWSVIYVILGGKYDLRTLLSIFVPSQWPFWFLIELFKVQVIVYVALKISKGIYKYAFLLTMLVFVLPFCAVPRMMVPMFWVGMLIRRNYSWIQSNWKVLGGVALVVGLILELFWTPECMTYSNRIPGTLYHMLIGKHGYSLLNLLLASYRFCVGAFISVGIICLMHAFSSLPKFVETIGSSTQSIYILQTLLLERILSRFVDLGSYMPVLLAELVVSPIIAIIIVLICASIKNTCPRSRFSQWLGIS